MKLIIVGIAFFACQIAWAAGPLKVIFPASESLQDTRFIDLVEMLKVSLDKTVEQYGPYLLEETPLAMSEARYLAELDRGSSVLNVAWSSTSEEKERLMRPIRIPLRKGLLGYRISLITEETQAKFDALENLSDLRLLSIGQGLGWGDIQVYEKNGFQVVTASSYEGLFKMLAQRRFDHFPRGVNEIFAEYQARRDYLSQIQIEQHTLIYYPWPYYFFVSKQNAKLAERIERGLNIMIADKTFDQIFLKHHGDSINKARLSERRAFVIKNPLLPKETPVRRKELWYDPLNLMSQI
ncbi:MULTISPECIES: ABC transporter substrate-binding protein [unclassified Hahella]|uniref:substrate-binding periplasmic protein n=1 Tax=unclassified Hahella TaxID=2624107 RepID=UPI001C1E96D0|nr:MULTISPECIES: transporter substrate-binding domain-containing protein [unclassified Hahella]MBU6952019.1 transporter substrate-binding domain-containing protein [Hahella sp. HN01]MDG9670019.1 transporter substrate-binding domain-containing protein [Hahella sp. CR1]